MVGQFLAGVIVGILIGLTLAPLLRSWVLWQIAKTWRDREQTSSFSDPTAPVLRGER